MSDPLVSFVVPLFNHVEQTREMLASLVASLPLDLHYEVIFADDGSTDETRNWLSGLTDARIQFILNERNFGYAKTNNLGVRCAKGRYLGLLNNDLVFQPGWFEPMWTALEDPKLNAGIVGNLQYRAVEKVLDHAGVALMPSGKFEHLQEPLDVHAKATPVYAVTGACMLMRRADFDAAGGFDEVFVNGCEDIDLCLKVRANGKQIYVAPDSKILHHVSLSRSRVSLQNERNSQYLYHKWRKDIKLQLTRCWIDLLGQPETEYAGYVDGDLTSSFKSKPHIAAMTMSEAALLREEARWAKELGTPTVKDIWPENVKASGLVPVPKAGSFLALSEVVVGIDFLKTACNFYVCGRLLTDFDAQSIEMTLSVNNHQAKTFRLEQGNVVNVGLINPLVSPSGRNTFKFNVYFINADGKRVGAADNTMLITHFVVNDQMIRDFSISAVALS
ncbi:glycosyltransferase family 2 protein [Limnohabitans sp.]|uniref:glycosyltransferase family 2 protein n=1 Tax=Limnohabitans sp. TaxID=1907725 RepID=UPI0038B9607D